MGDFMIDLHIHTDYSDGTNTVIEVLEEAQRLGLSVISIADHNTVGAYLQMKNSPEIRALFSGEIIPGCELTTTYKGETIEVLGYGINVEDMNEFLKKNVLTFEQKQLKEFGLIAKRFQEIGIKFDIRNIVFNPKVESCREAFRNEIIKYDINRKFFLHDKSMNDRSSFTRNEIYNPKSLLYVDESSLYMSLKEAIAIIHKTGGLAFLAHTYAYSPTIAEQLDEITSRYELDGLECHYTTFTDVQTEYIEDYCNKRRLFKSGGTDYHGTNKVNHNMGVGAGNMNIPESYISDWYNAEKKKSSR
jgi:predicted metal-dependent phosphoesterase TrpH